MKTKIKAFVHWQKFDWEEDASFEVYSVDMTSSNSAERILVCETEIEVEIPDDFDPTPGRIERLKAAKQEILAKAHVQAENIEEQIQRLLCIEHKPERERK